MAQSTEQEKVRKGVDDPPRVKSADRALAIFEVFEEHRRPMSAKEIAETLEMPRSSTNVLLRSLISAGYLQYDQSTSRYFPTLKVVGLGDWLFEGRYENAALVSIVRDLSATTLETTTLSMRHGFKVRFLNVFESTLPIALNVRPGDGVLVFGSASGLAVLAASDDDDIADLVDRYNRRSGRVQDKIDRYQLMDEIGLVRERQYSLAYDKWLADAGAIAVPVRSDVFGAPTAIGVGGPTFRIKRREDDIIQTLLEQTAHLRPAPVTSDGLAVAKGGHAR